MIVHYNQRIDNETYLIEFEQLEHKTGDHTSNTSKQIDDNQTNVGNTRFFEQKTSRVHHWSD